MDNQNFRIIVELNGSVEYSRYAKDGETGGVASLNNDQLQHVEAQLKNALLHVKELLSHK